MNNKYRKIYIVIAFFVLAITTYAQYVVTGGTGAPIKAEQTAGDKAERLEVYLVYGSNVSISYSSSSSNHTWYRYKNRRLDAEKIPCRQNGNISTVTNVEDGYGYFVDEGAISKYVWIIDYSKYQLKLSNLRISDKSDPCGGLFLAADGEIQPLYFYWPNSGARRQLPRQYDVMFDTLEYDQESKTYRTKQETLTVKGDLYSSVIPAPLCDTYICVKGDNFARHFGKESTLCIDMYEATAVDAHIDTLLIEQEAPNMNNTNSGYCAPATVEFDAIANQPTAAMFNWTIFREGEENNPVVRFSGDAMDYTFNEAGNFTVRLEVSDHSTSCTVQDEIQIEISESYLKIPNAFSPGTTPGVNDEFRVAYKSLVSFKAWIFNRWGIQIYHWTNPAQGWDGKKGGKYVQPGVYFYVIEAEGSDGIKYKKKGDINILRPKTIKEENENIKE